ncbi:hypothetical protein NKJ72_03570 [Mesorhizobium sp. M0045]|uniref:hypothetical protein n=1 Tax=unclassified Mesorhizobium TaxID=325217 RepID=UPI003334D723
MDGIAVVNMREGRADEEGLSTRRRARQRSRSHFGRIGGPIDVVAGTVVFLALLAAVACGQ